MGVFLTAVKTGAKAVGKTAAEIALAETVRNGVHYVGSKIDNKINSRGSKGSKKKKRR